MKQPDFLVLGAQKAGSTWIYDCLKNHPEVFMPMATELMYFNRPNYRDPELRQEYLANFSDADGFKRVGEKTPGYFWTTDRNRSKTQPPAGHNADIPASVRDVLGDNVDFIVSLRHPVWRAISCFGHHVGRGRIKPDKSLKQQAGRLGILDIGFYAAHLEAWIKAVGRERIEVLIFEDDIVANPELGYQKICRFLNVSETFLPDGLRNASNEGGARKMHAQGIKIAGHPIPVSANEIAFLIDAYADDIEKIKSILGLELAGWDQETARLKEWCKKASPAPRPTAAKVKVAPVKVRDLAPLGVARQQQLRDLGLDGEIEAIDSLDGKFVFEAPVALSGLKIHGRSRIGAFTKATSGCAFDTRIGRYCVIGRDVRIGHGTPAKQSTEKFVTKIGNDVTIGDEAVILTGLKVGNGAIIEPNSVVTSDVAPFAIVAGNPAVVKGWRFNKPQRGILIRLKWWRFTEKQLEGVDFNAPLPATKEIERRVNREGMKPYAPRPIALS